MGKKRANRDKRGRIGQNLFKDGDYPRRVTILGMVTILGIVTFLEKATVLLIVTILRMITILVMVTIKRDGDHHKGWFIFKCDLFI